MASQLLLVMVIFLSSNVSCFEQISPFLNETDLTFSHFRVGEYKTAIQSENFWCKMYSGTVIDYIQQQKMENANSKLTSTV